MNKLYLRKVDTNSYLPKRSKITLTHSQKQEKLLELYKELNIKRRELIAMSRNNTWSWKLDIEIKEIEKQIKEIEK